MSEVWGVLGGYRDAGGTWRHTDPAVAGNIRSLLTDPTAPPPTAQRFTRPDRRDGMPGRWDLHFEDGSEVVVEDRLPPGLPLGVHRLEPSGEGEPLELVVAPDRAPSRGARRWGWSVHVPLLWSRRGRGIGDLADLASLGSWARDAGASTLATLPLHAPLPLEPRQASPYYPSSRVWRDPLLIDPAKLGLTVRAAPDPTDAIDRDQIWRATRPVLWQAWQDITGHERDRFTRWRRDQGRSLERFATHEALAETHRSSWPSWPSGLRDATSRDVARFAQAQSDLVGFHAWLQWLVDRQLTDVTAGIDLVADLAIGVRPDGADTWCSPRLFATGARIGAPPDLFNAAGQDWGLAPFDPGALRRAGYAPFVDALRSTLRHAKDVRIDHVMGLFRLWWIPNGRPAAEGAYVRMPDEDLLDLVCLEATRVGARVIGEDLGTVEDEVRAAMHDRHLLGTRVVWFSDDPPSRLPADCMASISNHDLPTVRGLLEGSDAAERHDLDISVNPDDEAHLLGRLESACREGGADGVPPRALDATTAALRALAEGPATLVIADVRDALACAARVNMPGTDQERPNWSIPLPTAADDLSEDPGVRQVVAAMTARSLPTAPRTSTPGGVPDPGSGAPG